MNQKPISQTVDPRSIRIDLGTQTRKEHNEATVQEYAELMENGVTFPPCAVFFDVGRQEYIMADGFHRLFAHLEAKPNDAIVVDQYLGSVEDARWFAIGANKTHGLKRSNEDKRNAVKMALFHENGVDKSNSSIAEHVGVHEKTVRNIRQELELASEIPASKTRTGADGRTYHINNIGKTTETVCHCNDCGKYDFSCCMVDGELHDTAELACKDFSFPVPEPERIEGVKCKAVKKSTEVAHRVSRRHKGEYVRVPLDKTNPDRAAVEIRMFLGENYLAALTQSAIKILKET